MNIYIYIHTHVHIVIYIYTYRERKREREREGLISNICIDVQRPARSPARSPKPSPADSPAQRDATQSDSSLRSSAALLGTASGRRDAAFFLNVLTVAKLVLLKRSREQCRRSTIYIPPLERTSSRVCLTWLGRKRRRRSRTHAQRPAQSPHHSPAKPTAQPSGQPSRLPSPPGRNRCKVRDRSLRSSAGNASTTRRCGSSALRSLASPFHHALRMLHYQECTSQGI